MRIRAPSLPPTPLLLLVLLAASLALAAAAQDGRAAAAQGGGAAGHAVISGAETDQPGDDPRSSLERVGIDNPSREAAGVGGREMAPASAAKAPTIPPGTEIGPGRFLAYSYQPGWPADASGSAELRDADGGVVDKTPAAADTGDGPRPWQGIRGALDSDPGPDRSSGAHSAGSTNGRPEPAARDEPVTVTIGSAKPSYVFGETVVLSGRVSEQVSVVRPVFAPAEITITVTGPDYRNTVTKYPDRSLGYSASMSLRQVLGVGEGEYTATAEYAGSSDSAVFSVGHAEAAAAEEHGGALSISTDAGSYLPGQTVTIFASTSEEVPLAGLEFSVEDPAGDTVAAGTLFPSSDVNVRSALGGGSSGAAADAGARFVTTMFVDTVSPAYGEYRVSGEYSSQAAEHFFTVRPDVRDRSVLSLGTDRPAYEPGDTVVVSGRSNQYYVPSLSLEVVRAANTALDAAGGTGMKILDGVRLEGDGTFSYEIPIPESFSSFGNYRVTVAGEIGEFSATFMIVEDAAGVRGGDAAPLHVTTDKRAYDLGDGFTISGHIREQVRRSSFETPVVHLEVRDADGLPLRGAGAGGADSPTRARVGTGADLSFTAIPDQAGSFSVDGEITRSFFAGGAYTIHARYLDLAASTPITVSDPLRVGSARIVASLDREVYGLGDTVTLTGSLGTQVDQDVILTLHRPDGGTDRYGTGISNGSFSWMWEAPRSETSTGAANERVAQTSNLGVYRLGIETGGIHAYLLFKVSADPGNDRLSAESITVGTDKPIYRPGDRMAVSGSVAVRPGGVGGSAVPDVVVIQVLPDAIPPSAILEARVYPDPDGAYSSAFGLPATAFGEGAYSVRASYDGDRADAAFSVARGFAPGGESAPPRMSLALDGGTYRPGDTVVLTGKPDRAVYVEEFLIDVIRQSESQSDCGMFYCGEVVGEAASARPDPSAGFSHSYRIPDGAGWEGSYEIRVDAGFGTGSVKFDVAGEPQRPAPAKMIDKAGRIPDAEITISPELRLQDGHVMAPQAISGSLVTSARGEEPGVNLRVASADGTCVIGQAAACLVSDSTRARGSVYTVVEFGGSDHRVRYSGPDAKLERFSILPAQEGGRLAAEPFDVSVVKGEQASRFYYKITYAPAE